MILWLAFYTTVIFQTCGNRETFQSCFKGDREGVCFVDVSTKQLTAFSQDIAHNSFYPQLIAHNSFSTTHS
jgi:hypothetical protein